MKIMGPINKSIIILNQINHSNNIQWVIVDMVVVVM